MKKIKEWWYNITHKVSNEQIAQDHEEYEMLKEHFKENDNVKLSKENEKSNKCNSR